MKRIALFICLISALLFSSVAHATIISGAKKSGDYEYTISGNEATIVYYTGNFKTSTTIPSTLGGKKVTTIAWGVFSSLWKLESVTIPDSVVTIHDGAFLNSTGLKTVNIGKGVKKITGNPFDGCTSLKTINVSSQNTYLQVINGVLFTKNPKRLVCYPATKTANTYTLPNGVVEIGDGAFSGNPYLKTLVIPASVKTIHKTAFNDGHGRKQNITLDVSQNEYAKSYAIKNNMKYVESVDKKTAKKTAAPTAKATGNTASSKSSVQTIKKPTSYKFLKATLLSIDAKATAKAWCSDGLRETAIMALALDYLKQSGSSQMRLIPESTFIGYKDEVLYAVIPVIEGETVFFEMDTEYETCKYCIYDGIDAVRNEQIIASNCAKNYWGTEWKAMESALYALLK